MQMTCRCLPLAGGSTKGNIMSNTISTPVAPAITSATVAAAPATVVQHDTTAAQPMAAAATAQTSISNYIEQLVIEREVWENNAYRTSNDQLYALLQKCYATYKAMGGDSVEAATLRQALKTYMNLKNIRVSKSAHGLVKIVKCVFGDDRRRASAYGIVLRSALAQKVAVADLPAFIRNNGGVEEIRLAKSPNAMTAKQKAFAGAQAVVSNTLGVFASEGLLQHMDATNIGANAVLIGTWQSDGSVVVRAVVQNSSAINAALASYYSNNKTAVAAQAVVQTAANDAQVQQAAITAAAQAAVVNG